MNRPNRAIAYLLSCLLALQTSAASFSAIPFMVVLVSAGSARAQTSDFNLPKLGDVDSDDLSPASERRLGRAVMAGLRREGVVHDDVEMTAWLNEFARPLTRTRHAQGFNFEFFLVRDRSINAFALPGGFIGVNTGLIESAGTEAELASVIAHEIAHVTQRHLARQFGAERNSAAWMIGSILLALLAAKKNPDAAAGLVHLGQAQAQSQFLAFSRDAEREADRVGLEMLGEAGFSPNASVAFFQRLQTAMRVYDSNVSEYFRTHPLTTDRITDMQMRTMGLQTKIRPDSAEFTLVKARLRALADGSRSGAQDALEYWRTQAPRDAQERGAALYGQAIAHAQLGDFSQATQLLDESAKLLPKLKGVEHPMILGERIRLAQKQNQGAQALALANRGLQQLPDSAFFLASQLQSLAQLKQWNQAAKRADEILFERRSDPVLWRIAAEIYSANQQPALAHRAAAERLALEGQWRAALLQMQSAQRLTKDDFVLGAIVDARIKELSDELKREADDPLSRKRIGLQEQKQPVTTNPYRKPTQSSSRTRLASKP